MSSGMDGRVYPWGNSFDKSRCNADERGTTPVGAYAERGDASPYGVHDLAGNVREWTGSLVRSYPYSPSDGREDPDARGDRVLRGDSWSDPARYVRVAYRLVSEPDSGINYCGFRLVLAAPSS